MNNWLSYYLVWALIPIAMAAFSQHPAALGVIVVAFFARNWLPDPVVWMRGRGRIRNLAAQLEANPGNIKAARELAMAQLERRRPRRAIAALETALTREPDSAELHYLAGLAQAGAKDDAAALAHFERSFTLDPRHRYGEALYQSSLALLRLDRIDEALPALTRYSKVNSSSVETFFKIAQCQARLGAADLRARALQEALATYRQLPTYERRKQWGWYLRALAQRA